MKKHRLTIVVDYSEVPKNKVGKNKIVGELPNYEPFFLLSIDKVTIYKRKEALADEMAVIGGAISAVSNDFIFNSLSPEDILTGRKTRIEEIFEGISHNTFHRAKEIFSYVDKEVDENA